MKQSNKRQPDKRQGNKGQPNKRQASNRKVKSTVFTTFFSDPENAAKLYTALEGIPAEPEDIEYTTLEGVLFLVRKNDMANSLYSITEMKHIRPKKS